MNKHDLRFAFDANKKLISIKDAKKGLDYFCCGCKEKLVLKQGEVNAWHYAHYAYSDCAGGRETQIHLLAKEFFMSKKELVFQIKYKFAYKEHTRVFERKFLFKFDSVVSEKSFFNSKTNEKFIPDIALLDKNEKPVLFIEVAYSHFIDNEKKIKLENFGVPCIEIDLSKIDIDSLEVQIMSFILHKSFAFPYERIFESEINKAKNEIELVINSKEKERKANTLSIVSREYIQGQDYEEVIAAYENFVVKHYLRFGSIATINWIIEKGLVISVFRETKDVPIIFQSDFRNYFYTEIVSIISKNWKIGQSFKFYEIFNRLVAIGKYFENEDILFFLSIWECGYFYTQKIGNIIYIEKLY